MFSLTTNTVQLNAQLRQPTLGILLSALGQRNDPQPAHGHSVPPQKHVCPTHWPKPLSACGSRACRQATRSTRSMKGCSALYSAGTEGRSCGSRRNAKLLAVVVVVDVVEVVAPLMCWRLDGHDALLGAEGDHDEAVAAVFAEGVEGVWERLVVAGPGWWWDALVA